VRQGSAGTGSFATRRTDRDAIMTRTIPQPPEAGQCATEESFMNNIVYIVGAIVIVLVILSFLGLR
jgi:small-conductance mechanosensitive channel